jgi:hypothetical protein
MIKWVQNTAAENISETVTVTNVDDIMQKKVKEPTKYVLNSVTTRKYFVSKPEPADCPIKVAQDHPKCVFKYFGARFDPLVSTSLSSQWLRSKNS